MQHSDRGHDGMGDVPGLHMSIGFACLAGGGEGGSVAEGAGGREAPGGLHNRVHVLILYLKIPLLIYLLLLAQNRVFLRPPSRWLLVGCLEYVRCLECSFRRRSRRPTPAARSGGSATYRRENRAEH
jgi:hypothetical protein